MLHVIQGNLYRVARPPGGGLCVFQSPLSKEAIIKLVIAMDTQDVPKKKKFYKRWWFWVLAVVVLFIIIGASSGGSKGVSVPATAETGSSVAAPEKKAATASAPQVLLDIAGSGSKTTQKFTAGGDWDLNWNYDCSNFGQSGNLIVMIYDGNGSLSYRNTGVNQLGDSGSGVEHYHNSGTFYLVVNSVCKWNIEVKG